MTVCLINQLRFLSHYSSLIHTIIFVLVSVCMTGNEFKLHVFITYDNNNSMNFYCALPHIISLKALHCNVISYNTSVFCQQKTKNNKNNIRHVKLSFLGTLGKMSCLSLLWKIKTIDCSNVTGQSVTYTGMPHFQMPDLVVMMYVVITLMDYKQ